MSDRVLKAIEFLLYPLVRLIIARNVSYGTLADITKFVMVKEAEKLLAAKNSGTISDSRLSVVTGIHRKEVKRIRALKSNDIGDYEPSLASQVVAKWAGEKKLRSRISMYKLRRKKANDTDYDFDDLVRSISKDIRPRVVLEELIDRGLVTETEDDCLELHPENLALKQDQEETLHYLSLNIHDHLSTSVDNLINQKQKQFDRCVHYHGLSADAVGALRKLAEEKAMQTLVEVNTEAQALINDPKNTGDLRMNFGSYFFEENTKK